MATENNSNSGCSIFLITLLVILAIFDLDTRINKQKNQINVLEDRIQQLERRENHSR